MFSRRLLTLSAILLLGLSACALAPNAGAPVAATAPAHAGGNENWPVMATSVPATNAPAAEMRAATPAATPEAEMWAATPAPLPTQSLAGRPTAVPPTPLAASGLATPVLLVVEPVATPLPTLPPDNTFKDYGVNPFVDTTQDHLSTFALDVDTAAYSVARRYITEGQLPPPEAVRAEEFVNYFDQGYPLPPQVAFGLYADGALSPFHQDGTYLIRLGVQGYAVPENERKPLALTFVIDVSGSMQEQNRLELVKQALNLLVDRLRPADTVAIVAYSTNAWVILNPTNGAQRQTILDSLYTLTPQQTTNVEGGLRLGYQLAWQMYRPDATNRVILCSDGVANVGNTSPEAILEFVRGYTDQGITLTAIGVGMGNYNDVLLEQLADKGDGNYAYVDTLEEAQKVFVEDLTSTLQVIALDAKVQVDFNPEVVLRYRLIGYENRAVADQDFRNDAVDAGEIGAGHTATAIYAVQFRPQATGRVATLQLRWQDPTTRAVQEINGNFNTWDLAADFQSAALRYQLAATVAQYAEVLRQSPWAAETSLYTLSTQAARLAASLPEDAEVREFAGLVSRASEIRGW